MYTIIKYAYGILHNLCPCSRKSREWIVFVERKVELYN